MPSPLFPCGNGGILDIAVNKNIRFSNTIISGILDSDHPPIIFHIPNNVRTKNVLVPLEKFTNWDRFQSLVSNLISPRNEINSRVEADKAERALRANIASSYRLSTSKITLSELNNDLPGLNRLLRYYKTIRKYWQQTRDPGYKKAVNWVSNSIRNRSRKKAFERLDTKICKY
jgi:hypothetical protein